MKDDNNELLTREGKIVMFKKMSQELLHKPEKQEQL